MARKLNITPEELRKRVNYDPNTGIFTWLPRTPDMYVHARQTPEGKCKRFNNMRAGRRADIASEGGYRRIEFGVRGSIRASHAAWIYMYGQEPKMEIDHINNDPSDNRIENLREATSSQQKQNRRKGRMSKDLPKGVGFHKPTGKYRAYIGNDHIGLFDSVEDAASAHNEAAIRIYGQFARV